MTTVTVKKTGAGVRVGGRTRPIDLTLLLVEGTEQDLVPVKSVYGVVPQMSFHYNGVLIIAVRPDLTPVETRRVARVVEMAVDISTRGGKITTPDRDERTRNTDNADDQDREDLCQEEQGAA